MDDVKRYLAQKTPIGTIMKPCTEGYWVTSEDFDAQRLRADTAEAALAEMTADRDSLKGIASAYIASDGAKDLRIIAAEQRIASHERMLRFFANLADIRQVGTLAMDYVAALNPKPEAGSHE